MTQAGKRIIILGAASAIAEATARIWAADNARLLLVGRDKDRLDVIAADLKARGAAAASTVALDCARSDASGELNSMVAALGGLDILLLAYGSLRDQKQLEADPEAAEAIIRTNFTSAAAWCLAASSVLERQGSGVLLVIGSVAGDRGRRSNFIYGACKGGLAHLVEGIAHKLARTKARAIIVKPGFVDTPMTASFEKKGWLWAKPDAVAQIIAGAAERGAPVVYAPPFWRWIMVVIRHLPTVVFDRLNI